MRLIDMKKLKDFLASKVVMMTDYDDGIEASRIDEYIDEFVASQQPEPHWIPVTKRLPEEGIPVNVTWVNRKPEFYYSEIKDKPYTATAIYFHGRWFWYSCVIEDWLAEYGSNESFLANLQEAVDRDIEITAWVPLPEPFKGVTS